MLAFQTKLAKLYQEDLPNKDKLGTIVSYHQWLPAFEQLFHDTNGEFILFYQYAKKIAELKHDEKTASVTVVESKNKKVTATFH